MTTLGKILVIVNLVFSMVTAALIIMVYATRTNWRSEYDKRVGELKAAYATVQTYRDEADQVRKSADAELVALRAQLDTVTKERNDARADADQKKDEVGSQATIARQAGATSGTAAEEMKRLRGEVDSLNKVVAQRDKAIHEFELQLKDLRDKSTLSDINFKSENERNRQLLEQVAGMTRELDRLKANRGGGASAVSGDTQAVRPPPDDVRGKVLEVDPKTGLVTVSVGSDAGLAKGQTLEVFRTRPEPKYLGTIRILDAHHHEAVGRPVLQQRFTTIQKGDEVASKILGQR